MFLSAPLSLPARPNSWTLGGTGRRFALPLVVLGGFLVSGCASGPEPMANMEKKVAERLVERAPSQAKSSGKVSLKGGFAPAVKNGVEQNAGYRAASLMEADAMSLIAVSAAARKPQASVNANAGALNERNSTTNTTTLGVAGGLTVSQLIYDGGASTAAVNRATAEAIAARAQRTIQANELAFKSAKAWVDVWEMGTRLNLLRSRTAEMDTLMEQIERMSATGMTDLSALDGARRQVVGISLEKARLQADLDEAGRRFELYFRQAPGALGKPADLISLTQARQAVSAWRNSPELQQLAANILVAEAALASAEAAFKPKARLQTGISSPMKSGETVDTTFGFVVEYSFSDGGRRKAELASARSRAAASEETLTERQSTIEADLDLALLQVAALDKSLPLVQQQIRLSASERETARSQIATGQSNLRQLMEVEIESYRAKDREISMVAERMRLLLTIAARTGALAAKLGIN